MSSYNPESPLFFIHQHLVFENKTLQKSALGMPLKYATQLHVVVLAMKNKCPRNGKILERNE